MKPESHISCSWECGRVSGNEPPHSQMNSHFGNCQFDSRPLKVGNRPDFLMCRWSATYHWKALDKGYNCVLDLTLIEGLHTKLWVSKVVRVPILGILGVSGQNDIWVLAMWPRIDNTYKGEGASFPQVQVMVSLVNPCLLMIHLCTKGVQTMH